MTDLRTAARILLLCTLLALAGCGSLLRNPVPVDLMATASIPGMPDVRAPAGTRSAFMTRDMAPSFTQESPRDFPPDANGIVLYPHLALWRQRSLRRGLSERLVEHRQAAGFQGGDGGGRPGR